MRQRFVFFIIAIPVIVCTLEAAQTPHPGRESSRTLRNDTTDRIIEVQVRGNHVTRTSVVERHLGFGRGDVYDSVRAAHAEKRLAGLPAFTRADIIALRKPGGTRVYVMLDEKPLFVTISDCSGEIHQYKYGTHQWWVSGMMELAHTNFRGMMEVLKTRVRLGHWYGGRLSWTKPLLPGPYVVQAAVTAGARPNSIDPWYTTYARESVLFGRRFGDEWFAYAQLQHAWHGFDVKSDTMAPAFTRYHDIIGVFGAQMDTRNRRYNPSRGLYQWNRCAVTHTVAHDSLDYVQLFSGIAYYTPGVWQDNTVALRMALLLRSDDPGRFKRLAFGGDFPLRGFATSGVYTLNDKNASINNAVLANAEYRFPLFSMPPVIVPSYFLSSDPVLTVQYHVDGALFTDLGYFWHHASAPRSEYGYAGALGAGLRLRVPLVKSAVSFDMAWPVLARGIRGYTGSLFPEGIPYLHMYVGIPF